MHVAIGSDHAGFELKEAVKTFLAAEHHKVVHLGSDVAAGLGTLQRAIRAALEDRRRQTAAAGGMRSTQANNV